MYKNSFFYKSSLDINKQNNRGITLIALVITIIVLLILASISISMLTGTNGILTQAQKAKETNDNSATEEKVKLIATTTKMQAEIGTLDANKLVEEITTSYGGKATKSENGFPIAAEIDGKKFEINSDGNIAVNKNIKEITGNEETNTITQDSLGNRIVVPAGFEIVNPDDNVIDGIIVKDKMHTNTAGSEFVWIPVGDIIREDTTTVNIELNRYIFDNNGREVKKDLNEIDEFWTENTDANHNHYYKNTIAKNIGDFITKAKSSHGYYIGRYEARDKNAKTERTDLSSVTNQIICTAENYVYNYVTQPQAAALSRGMYTGTSFESDLINSYAWDTAILFLQTFGINSKYSIQASLNSILANQGTNELTDTSKQDKICNVYDMASNCWEWSTETSSYSPYPCTGRGGYFNDSSIYTSSRGYYLTTSSDSGRCFRPILYL